MLSFIKVRAFLQKCSSLSELRTILSLALFRYYLLCLPRANRVTEKIASLIEELPYE